MPEYDDIDETTDEHPAERRIRDRETKELRAENAFLKAGLDLNDDQKQALLAVAKDDLTAETFKAKAEALGFLKPDAPEVDEVVATEERIAAAAVDSAPPPPPTAPLESVRERVQNLPSSQVQVGSPLYQEALAAIQQSGLAMGTVEHDGQFVPLAS